MALYKHIYHMLHSLDLWFINPNDKSFQQPCIHIPNLNNLDVKTDRYISKTEIKEYYDAIKNKIQILWTILGSLRSLQIANTANLNRYWDSSDICTHTWEC